MEAEKMTIDRKIEIMVAVREFIINHKIIQKDSSIRFVQGIGLVSFMEVISICLLFYKQLTWNEIQEARNNKTEVCAFYLGEIFFKHAPQGISEGQFWFPYSEEGKQKRIEVVDKVINDLKELQINT